MKTKVFYDGADLEKWADHPMVEGFTTNCSFVSSVIDEYESYENFSKKSIEIAGSRPISFQVVSEDKDGMERDAKKICSWGKNVYCKIPITTPTGECTVDLIEKLHSSGFNVNVTTIYTEEQIESLSSIFNKHTPTIVSVFAGGISDTGKYPDYCIEKAVETFKDFSNVEILWAGCQRLLSIKEAQDKNVDIVTVPGDILRKTDRLGTSLHEASVAKSKLFYEDAKKTNMKLDK
jgi:transaldolase